MARAFGPGRQTKGGVPAKAGIFLCHRNACSGTFRIGEWGWMHTCIVWPGEL